MAKSKNRLLSELINSSNNLTLVDDIPKISFTDSDTNTLASITANSSHLTYTTASAARDHIFKQDDTTRMLIDDLGINVTGTVTANSLAIDNLTVDGYTISSDSALVLDVAGNLTIDVDGTTIVLNDGGLNWGQFFSTGAGAFNIYSPQSNQDIVFRGNDGGTNIIALTIDMSVGGQLKGSPLGVSTPTYAFSNDSNTGMTRPTGDTLQLVTNGQERIRITDVGNVGIDRSTPRAKLDVNGSINIEQATSIALDSDDYSDTAILIPRGTFIRSNTTGDYQRNLIGHNGTTGNGSLQIGQQGTSIITDIIMYPGSSGNIRFYGSGSEDVRFSSDGKVGIGTTSPQTGLQVAKDWVSDYGSINISSGQNVLGGLGLRANNVYKGGLIYRDGTAGAYWELTAYGNEPFLFKTNNAERMRITNDGKVGIGTTSPGGPLHVKSSINKTVIIDSTISGSSLTSLAFQRSGADKWRVIQQSNDDVLLFYNDVGGTNQLALKSNGRVGINDTSPQGMLHVTSDSTTVDALYLESNVDSSSAAPVATFHRHSASPADADYLGQLKFKGENDADQEVVYAKITAKIQDASDGSEDGLIEFANKKAGSNVITARLRSDSLQLLNGTSLTVAGDATITGNLTVNGSTTTINSTTLTVDDKNIVLASGAADSSAANGAGITVDGANANITYTHATAEWDFNKSIHVSGAAGSGVKIDSGGAIVGGGATGGDTQLIYWGGGPMYYGRSSLGGTVSGHELRVGGVTKLNVNSSGNTIVSGNIGIGTSSPARRLTVQGGSGDNLPVRIIGGSGTNHGSIEFQDPNTTADYKVTIGSKADDFYIQAGGTEKVRVKSDGSVGIGTSSPNSYTNQRVLTINGTTHSRIDFETGDTLRGSVYGDSGSLNIDAGGNFVRFYAGNAEKMRLTNTGRLGIGITNPSSILHIHGNAGDPAKLTLSEGGATSRIYATRNSDTNSDLRFQTEIGGTIADVMKINYSGELKLGNLALASSTTAPLHVAKGSTDVQAIFGDNNSTIDDPSIRIIGRNTANTAIRYTFVGLDADANHGYIGYNAGAGGFVNALNFSTNGRVAIGHTSPDAPLHIEDTTSSAYGGLRVVGAGTGSGSSNAVQIADFGRTSSGSVSGVWIGGRTDETTGIIGAKTASGNIAFEVYQSGWKERMRIANSGRVGIGTSSPTAALHISSDGGDAELILQRTGAQASIWGLKPYNADFFIRENGTDRVTIKSGGNVGIGTTSPSADLHIEDGSGAKLFMGDTNGRNLRFRTANSGSQNTNISSYAGLYLGGADNQNHMLIDGTGKVGIGTVSPSKKLHIKDSAAHQLQLQGSNSYWNIGTGWSGYYQDFLLFATNSGEKMVIDNAGSVGIGTNSPNTKLHVNKTSSGSFVEAIRIENSGGGVDEGAYINWEVANTSGHGARIGAQREGSGGIALRFDTGEISSAPVERMRINHDGKVLFKPASAQTGYALFDDGVNGGIHIKADTSSITTEYITTGFGAFEEARFVASNFVFKNTGSSTRAVIDDSGNMGIGTTSPVNNGTNSQGLTINGTGNYQNLALQHNGTTQFLMYLNGPSGTFLDQVTADPMMFLTDDTERMRIQANGRIGINNTSPAGMLHIQSNDSTTNDSVNMLWLTALSTGTTTTGFGPAIVFQAERNSGVNQNVGKIRSVAEINASTNISSGLAFETGTVGVLGEKMRISYDGKVGIGTTSPLATLHVGSGSGTVNTPAELFIPAGDALMRTLKIGHGTSSATITTDDASKPMKFHVGGNEKVRIDTSGRVGIATTTNHAGSSLGYGLTIDSAGYSGSGLEIHRTGNSRFELYQNSTGGQYLDALGSAPFMILATGGTEKVRVAHAGHLQFNPVNSFSGLNNSILSSSNTYMYMMGGAAGLYLADNADLSNSIGIRDAGYMDFNTGGTGEKMRITSSGRVGIGQTNPQDKLHLLDGDIGIENSSGRRYRLIAETNGGFTIRDQNAAATRIHISASSNVGIGTSSPNSDTKLHVAGAVKAEYKTEDSSITGGLVFDTPRYKEYHFNWSGLTNHQVEMTCASYFMAIVEYMTFQTNGGNDIQEYHRGKWANNHTTHTWDEFESSGNTAAISATISAGQNNVSNSGKLTIAETYGSGSYSGSTLIVKVYFGDADFAISKTT